MSFVHDVGRRIAGTRMLGTAAFLLVGLLGLFASDARGRAIDEGFTSLSTMIETDGWATINHSDPLNPAVSGWSQCSGGSIPPAQSSPINSCAMAGFSSVAPDAAGIINSWLIGPVRLFRNGDVISFYTRTVTGNQFGDRLQFRLSTSGESTDIGTQATDVGDFTILLLDINPTYQVGAYPEVWTQYVLQINDLPEPTSGRFAFRYFIENGGEVGDTGYFVGVDTFVYTPFAPPAPAIPDANFDYDGDDKSDISVYRPASGTWLINRSSDGQMVEVQLGNSTDRIAPADFDGDGLTDVAVFRASEGNWIIMNSSTGTVETRSWGVAGDLPAPGDFDGDGAADLGVFRGGSGEWWIQLSAGGFINGYLFGQPGDLPMVGTFDNDNKDDIAVYRPDAQIVGAPDTSAWFWVRSSDDQDFGVGFGRPTDRVAAGDYDGDGLMDLAIVRPTGNESGVPTWYILRSDSGYTPAGVYYEVWGVPTDVPVPGDYDGDNKVDVAIWRGSTAEFWILNSTGGYVNPVFGRNGDTPTTRAYISNN